MKINLSTRQTIALIDKLEDPFAVINVTDLKEGVNALKRVIKTEVTQKNQKIESLIFELEKDGFGDILKEEGILDKLKSEVLKSGNSKQEKYFDEEGNFKEKK